MLCILSLRLLDDLNIITNKYPGQDQNQAAALMQVCERRRYFFICFQPWSVLSYTEYNTAALTRARLCHLMSSFVTANSLKI